MAKQLQLSVTLPFSYYAEQDSATGLPLLRYPSPRMIREYADALCAETELWKDCGELEIGAVRFEGGYVHMLKEEQLRQLIEQIRSVFSLSGDCEWIAMTCPGRYLKVLAPILSEQRFRIMLDIPSFGKSEADDHMLPFGPDFPKAESADYPAAGIRILREITGRTPENTELIQNRLAELRPKRVEMITLNGRNEETEAGQELQAFLLGSGYIRTAANEFALPGGQFRHTHDLSSLPEYIGLGLGAVSVCDGFLSRNTGDFRQYIAAGGNPALLYAEVKELS